MSAHFGSSNLFGAGSAAPPPPFGLRQRHSATAPGGNNGRAGVDENANPNSTSRDTIHSYGKFGSMSAVPAPPRMSLSSAGGRSAFGGARTRSATAPQNQQQQSTESSSMSLVPSGRNEEQDLSLWVVGYGYRNEAHFRALYRRLEGCGTITARRGGLACFGDGDAPDGGDNWVAVRYGSVLCAQKALCQHGNFVSVGGSTMVIGVMPLAESDAAARLGINVGGASREKVTLSGSSYSQRNHRELKSEEDIMLYEDDRGDGTVGNEVKSGLDSLCGKVLAWFFMWDTRA